MTQHLPERDYPINHPKAVDYNGQPYTPPDPPLARDYPKGHPKAADSPQNIAESLATTEDIASRYEASDAAEAEQSEPAQPAAQLPAENPLVAAITGK